MFNSFRVRSTSVAESVSRTPASAPSDSRGSATREREVMRVAVPSASRVAVDVVSGHDHSVSDVSVRAHDASRDTTADSSRALGTEPSDSVLSVRTRLASRVTADGRTVGKSHSISTLSVGSALLATMARRDRSVSCGLKERSRRSRRGQAASECTTIVSVALAQRERDSWLRQPLLSVISSGTDPKRAQSASVSVVKVGSASAAGYQRAPVSSGAADRRSESSAHPADDSATASGSSSRAGTSTSSSLVREACKCTVPTR
mmetsp:Transcript_8480/g.27042  ORF Transcript_8480/g.27042 Transcript_8480/m.27042 type:complete len:261 (+) Transcript_8480:1104-1886(+)